MNQQLRPFHLAFPVKNLEEAKRWYTDVLGCQVGRESDDWVDFNMFGHQVVAHLSKDFHEERCNEVDGGNIPVRHFGVILDRKDWLSLKESIECKGIEFVISPVTRFKGKRGEQSTMFIKDPSGNFLEFKSFADDSMIFEK